MKILTLSASFVLFLALLAISFNACRPVRNMTHPPAPWSGDSYVQSPTPAHQAGKKNIFIIADAATTVLFDMLAPFYLFNATGNANVYIIAKDNTPILVKRDLFVCPQITFAQADSLQLHADVIVVPALSKRDEQQDTTVVNWIKTHFSGQTKLLAICDGASTAAATGLYDGKPLTCHASDYANLKQHFSKPEWVQNLAVTKSGNLYSTAGVSNAVEGSLRVISDVFDTQTMQKVLKGIAYPAAAIKTGHNSIALSGSNKFTVVKKILFRKNRKIALLIEDGIDEFELACITETYGRTLPACLSVINLNSSSIHTKYGLSLLTTVDHSRGGFDELHVPFARLLSAQEQAFFRNTAIVHYEGAPQQYLIDVCLQRIAMHYGSRFRDFVKISLDYN
ncbi:MAG TPA: DJ-1/PfpI family protein [Chitinophagaceae bacterium]|nr:DJ-1/PfpI family protein [Chitinophagaceae bacterium]